MLRGASGPVKARCAPKLGAMNRRLLLAAVGVAVLGLGACALLPAPRSLNFSQAEVQALVARQFPQQRTLLEVFDVTAEVPRLQLLAERNRVVAEVPLRVRERLLSGRWQGRLRFEAALRWEPADQTVRLAQVQVQELRADEPSGLSAAAVERVGAALARRMLEDSTLYRLEGEQAAKLQRLGVVPDAVAVTVDGLEVRLKPLPQR